MYYLHCWENGVLHQAWLEMQHVLSRPENAKQTVANIQQTVNKIKFGMSHAKVSE